MELTETAQMLRHRRSIVPTLVFLLLWGIWAFSLHIHHEDATLSHTECQLCQFGMHGNGILPESGVSLIPESRWSLTAGFSSYLPDAVPLPARVARSPPFVSPA